MVCLILKHITKASLLSNYGTSTSKLIPFGFNGFIIIISLISPFGMLPLSELPRHYRSLSSHSKISFITDCGGQHQAIALLSAWSSVDHPFLANAYDFPRLKGTPVSWAKVLQLITGLFHPFLDWIVLLLLSFCSSQSYFSSVVASLCLMPPLDSSMLVVRPLLCWQCLRILLFSTC